MDKVFRSADEAVADIPDEATIMFGGFGFTGSPETLIGALARRGVKGLTSISNNGGTYGRGIEPLMINRQISKAICTFPAQKGAKVFERLYLAGEVELEVLPQGTFVERIRAAGAGIGGFYIRTGVGTVVEEGKEKRIFEGQEYILELPLRADYAFVKAYRGDPWGNLVYRGTARNFNPIMAMAAKITIAEVEEIVPRGSLDPEVIGTPGIFVKRLVLWEPYEKPFLRG
jgi:3-oxoacid CoA-transferase A subunit